MNEEPAPYALITLESLTVKRFQNKEDWETAMNAVQSRGHEFVALKYHHSAKLNLNER